jgi:hypothetical protein
MRAEGQLSINLANAFTPATTTYVLKTYVLDMCLYVGTNSPITPDGWT